MVAVEGSKASVSNFTLNRSLGIMDAFVISRLAFLVAVGLASFAGSAVLGRRFVKQPERLRVALWWLLAVILALSCAWVNGGWPFPPRESQHWIGYVLLFATLQRDKSFSDSFLLPNAKARVTTMRCRL
jgi:drug/metabolite transporter (DMT)-like permease